MSFQKAQLRIPKHLTINPQYLRRTGGWDCQYHLLRQRCVRLPSNVAFGDNLAGQPSWFYLGCGDGRRFDRRGFRHSNRRAWCRLLLVLGSVRSLAGQKTQERSCQQHAPNSRATHAPDSAGHPTRTRPSKGFLFCFGQIHLGHMLSPYPLPRDAGRDFGVVVGVWPGYTLGAQAPTSTHVAPAPHWGARVGGERRTVLVGMALHQVRLTSGTKMAWPVTCSVTVIANGLLPACPELNDILPV
jgi:hypothetical protein